MRVGTLLTILVVLHALDAPARADCTLTDAAAGLASVFHSAVAWGDYDGDGDLDFVLTGSGAGGISKLYRNSGGANPTFSDAAAGFTGVAGGAVAWGDYDNDGDLDLALTGASSGVRQAKLYRNSGGANPTFSDVAAGWTPVVGGSVAWGDYDNDGDLDLVLTGDAGTPVATLYRNGGGANPTFADVGAALTGVAYSSVAWNDYDADGDLDLLLTGSTTLSPRPSIAKLYRNSGGANPTFSDAGAGLPGVFSSSVAWGDYDTDGDPDILLAGYDDAFTAIARVYRNGGGPNPAFDDAGAGLTNLPATDLSSVAWGDADADGDLDLLLTGTGVGSKLYRSSACSPNLPPTTPGGLTATYDANGTTFSWNAANDDATPSAALTYNLRVGTTLGGDEIVSAMAGAQGVRKLVASGNAGQRLQWTLKLPPAPAYYWSVQAIDGAYAGSPFATDRIVDVPGSADAPAAFALTSSQPHPFSTTTWIGFELPRAATVSVLVYDVGGRRVRTLARGRSFAAGRHSLQWDGRDDWGRAVGDGGYVCAVSMAGATQSRMVVVRR